MKAESGAIGRWVRQLARPERMRLVVATVGVLLLAAIGSVVLTAEGTVGSNAVPLSAERRAALTAAADSCPALTTARLAGQIMATTGFEATTEGGIGGLTAAEWEIWKPWDGAKPSDEAASALAVAHLTCDLIGRLRRDGFIGDRWRLAVAAFASSLDQVRAAKGVPADAADFVKQVEAYATWYAEKLPAPASSSSSPSATPSPSPSPSLSPSLSPSAEPSPSVTASPSSPTASASSTTTKPKPSTSTSTYAAVPPLDVNYTVFGDNSGLYVNGSAGPANGRMMLTTGLSQAGSIWLRSQLDTTKSFTSTFSAVVSVPTDGFAFVIQAQGPNAVGMSGSAIGYGARPNNSPAMGIRPSVAIEFDTWNNGMDGFDPAGDQHIAVTLDGDVTRHLVSADPGFSMRNNQPFLVWITYDAGQHALSVYAARSGSRPAQPLFVYNIDLARHLGTDRAYVGFTGGTGLTNLTDSYEAILSWGLRTI
jgi:hypothetical protein